MKTNYLLASLVLTASMFITSCEDKTKSDPIINTTNILSGTISTPTTLTADKVWTVDGDISIESDLIIMPGTTIKFKPGASMSIGYSNFASLVAVGLPDKPIIFTSAALIPSPGDWDGVYFYGSNSKTATKLAFVTIQYAGYYDSEGALNLIGTGISFISCTIQKNKYHGVVLDEESEFTSCALNTIKENGTYAISCTGDQAMTLAPTNSILAVAGYGIHIDYTTITKKGTWNMFSAPYVIEADLSIESANTAELTIAPGTIVKFTSNSSLSVGYGTSGKLIANGTALLPITFTSNASSPSKGDWEGLFFYSNVANGTLLNNCVVSYVGSYYLDGAITFHDIQSKVAVSNTTVSNSIYAAILSDAGSAPVLTNITYVNCTSNLVQE